MNTAIEMHDSELIGIETKDGAGFVLLDAYVHRTEGTPGESPGEGGIQRVRMSFLSMEVESQIGELPNDLYEGSLLVGESLQDNMVPYPAEYDVNVCLTMMVAKDARMIIIRGKSLTIQPEGDFRFVENVDFSWH